MKIGISCYPTYGGSGVVATELGKALADRGHEIHFISYALPYRLSGYHTNIYFHEVKVPEYPLFEYPPYALALATQMADIALRERLDLIHVHYAIPHATSAHLAKDMIREQHPLKIITTLHGTDITLVGADPSFMRMTRFSINQSDAVTAVSNFLKNETIRTFAPNKDIEVIYNFVDEKSQQVVDATRLRQQVAPDNEPILIHLSNFRPVKRVADTVQIANRVLRNKKIKLLLVGDGPDRSFVENMVREFGLDRQVIFLGKQEDIYSVLSLGDIFLMPSESESFGLAALEAMSVGLPCITSDAGGLPELNRHGVTGFTAPVGEVEKMGDYVLKILNDPQLRAKMSEQARTYAISEFHVDKIVPQYISLYERTLGSGRN